MTTLRLAGTSSSNSKKQRSLFEEVALLESETTCGHNVTCHIEALVDHKPLTDSDGDYFATSDHKTMRGSDWRGIDCDDNDGNVYPGVHIM